MLQIWNFLNQHPVYMSAATLGLYHGASAFVGSLEMPDASSSKFYRFMFRFLNTLAANYARSKASSGPAGNGPSAG